MSKTIKLLLIMSVLSLTLFALENSKSANAQGTKTGPALSVLLDPKIAKSSMSGRVFLVLSKSESKGITPEPRWIEPDPFFGLDVSSLKPGEPLIIDNKWQGFPIENIGKVPSGIYWASTIFDLNKASRKIFSSEGNYFSKSVKVEIGSVNQAPTVLVLDQVFHEPQFPETEVVKLAQIESKLLSKFHGRKIMLRAGIALPQSYKDNKDRKYPSIYEVPGFGGNHFAALSSPDRGKTAVEGEEVVHIMLDPDCPLGHHVFADSANNGPWGKALTEEFIPFLEKEFRLVPQSWARLVTGHSSGGWSSLWLQLKYPNVFGGVWSTAPDPVDFRDFQMINLYASNQNMFKDEKEKDRPIGRRGDTPFLFYKPFSDMEIVMGRGGQLGSFEAVFSERDSQGNPKKLWDRKTGVIDNDTLESWKKYDIRLLVENNKDALFGKLKNKIHVYMGDKDSFYLEGATRLLGDTLKKLGSDATVVLFAGKDHSNLMDGELRARISKEMAQSLQKGKQLNLNR
jgi:S-formylglutathione hydrolase FrmB